VLLGLVVTILVAFAWEYLWRETKPAMVPCDVINNLAH